MVNFRIELAGCPIEVSCNYNSTKEYCTDFITEKEPLFSLQITEKDILNEKENPDCNKKFSDELCETFALYRKISEELINYGIILFHGSTIAVDGEVYIFTAPSGTGKSTHSKIWRRVLTAKGHDVFMINDDKPLLKITGDAVLACGTPWRGVHKLGTNVEMKIKSICLLNRDTHNHIEQISPQDAFPYIYRQTYRPQNPILLSKTLELLNELLSRVSFYSLGCDMTDEAAEVSYNGMK